MTDVQVAKLKAAIIREEGQQKYNLKLLTELEADKKRKLFAVSVLLVISLLMVGVAFVLFEHAMSNNWLDEAI